MRTRRNAREGQRVAESLLSADEPYWIARSVGGAAGDALVTSLIACDLFHLWRRLTDWYELKPDDRCCGWCGNAAGSE